ncbi:YqgE/AlgH family protein [Ahrensia marina]|uniref:UPF0301 protein SU32_09705 n=1 Tax=Ahrensia marina TaxID=1514904 RepID=A0A0N0E7J2_9HYPH|nr:YqgE/AlgH family protein [Ahrensia marina]KPB01162.1 hypothetical protein SU32_09705 [Ahrensia marina]
MSIYGVDTLVNDKDVESGQFEGKFLLAMPTLETSLFDRSIIYICAHSHDGAMGFQVNKSSDMTIKELIGKTDIAQDTRFVAKNSAAVSNFVRNGGPVDEHRGFVLHSGDYHSDTTIPISENVYLTSNIEILRSIMNGTGPSRVVVSLGYAGWGPGQLEQEVADNAWLTLDADPEVIFDQRHEGKYERMLVAMGITPAHFIAEAGSA